MMQGAEINQSLFALKECMRHWVQAQDGKAGVHVNFRMSALTRVLADSFTRRDTQIAIVGTVSPSCNDTEHTSHTLRTIAMVAGTESGIKENEQSVKAVGRAPPAYTIPPKQWDVARLRKWLEGTRDGLLAPLLHVLPAGYDGKALMLVPAKRMETLWGASPELAAAVFSELRAETAKAEQAVRKARKEVRAGEQRRKAGIAV